ncbi:hypothetical protein [Natrinema salifodinae]|uniref:DUF7993 domain-containing protein n=1 Tax=Natrinema salifodinae TaxID=1202768 RepID=A0A1I0LWX7_9EURY|nr:hypothetical protein [Natrinema salifodinae]SEV79848.1 hypothetical protein SAMN05216285_0033 [Natrinema salifodinae]
MVEDRITDGRRIAELLSSEIDGREDGELEYFAVTNADRDVEPTADGARAYDIAHDDRDERIARAFVHEDRAHIEFAAAQDVAADAASDLELRVRPKATTPPRTLVFVESGAEVKRATDVLQRVSRAVREADQSL